MSPTRHPFRPAPVFVIMISALVLLMAGCAEYDSSVGGEVVSGTDEGVIKEMAIPASELVVYERGDILSSGTIALALGEQNGFASDIYYRYANLALLGDEVLEFDSAEVKLFSAGYVDEDAVSDVDEWRAEVLRVEEEIDPFTIRSADFESIEMTPIDTLWLGSWTGDDEDPELEEWSIELDSLTVARWVNDSLSYGIYIRPLDTAGFLKNFTQRAPTNLDVVPFFRIKATYVAGGDTIVDSWTEITPDFSTMFPRDTDLVIPADRAVLSQNYSRQLLARGDFSALDPSTMSINRVDLVLHADTDWDGALSDLNAMTWYDVDSEWEDTAPDSLDYGIASGLFYTLQEDTNRVRFNVTPVSRRWVSLPEENRGIVVRPTLLGLSPARAAFHNAESSEAAFRPYFHVIYTEYEAP